jgi:hypothetical protein
MTKNRKGVLGAQNSVAVLPSTSTEANGPTIAVCRYPK